MFARWRGRSALLVLGCVVFASGCLSSSKSEEDEGGGVSKPSKLPGVDKPVVAGLLAANDCPDLLARIQADVIQKIDAQAVLLKKGAEFAGYAGDGIGRGGTGSWVEGPSGDFGSPNAGAAGSGGTGAPSPSAPPGDNAGSGGQGAADPGEGTGSGPIGHSDTNTQVEGVDEADIVKTDESGENVYLIHGNTLFRLTAWPPESTRVDDQVAIEGNAVELFIADGKAVVFSHLYNQGDLVPLASDANGSSSYAGGAYYQPYYYGAPFTKITTIDVSTATPKVVRELYIEGSYLSSRRIGATVRAIIQGGFHTPPVFHANIEYQDPWGNDYAQEDIDAQVDAWRDRLVAAIETTEVTDWVPVERERKGGKLVEAEPRCVDFHAPPPALAGYGLTNVVSLDLSDPQSAIGGAIILGNADTVYANAEQLVLAQRDYRFDRRFLEKEQTVLHLFDLDADKTTYRASGFVPGHVLNQFSIDFAGDTLRVATQQNIWSGFVEILPLQPEVTGVPDAAARTQTDSRVLTLQVKDKTLVRMGITPPLGEDGESIRSARFIGDRGYVTTARNVDPLSVVDLSDPAELRVLGELHIPGFSEYMHPLDATHLLTIGRNTDSSGFDIGLRLQIFDVSDPTDPMQTAIADFAPGGYSEASNNHKAFTYWLPEGETDGLLAFPYVQYDTGFVSSLQLFRVSVAQGFSKLGAIDHTSFFETCYDSFGFPTNDYYVYGYCQQPEVRRGLFVQDEAEDVYVYSFSYGGVLVHALSDLAQSVAQAALPSPDFSEHRLNEVTYEDMGSGGTSGTGGFAGGAGGAAGASDAGTGTGTGGAGGGSADLPSMDGGMAPAPEPLPPAAGEGG